MDLFGARRLPLLARGNYVAEMRHLMLWGLFAGLVEGNVCAVVAAKTFGGSPLLITVVAATPMFANLLSVAWGVLCRGRRRLLLLIALGAASVTCVATIGATPHSHWGGWLFAAQIGAARVFLSGVVTVRASLWRSNYPAPVRGQITGRLQFARSALGLVAIVGAGAVFDAHPAAYRWLYPAVAVVGAAALLAFTGARVRGERAALRAWRRSIELGLPDSSARIEPFSLVAELVPTHWLREMIRVLRTDRRFARYCAAQSLLGSAAMMTAPIYPLIFTRSLDLSYLHSNALLDVLPQLVLLVSLASAAAHFDRVGVLRFRVINAAIWLSSILVAAGAAAVLHGAEPPGGWRYLLCLLLFLLSRLVQGVAMAGGAIAWNIGHLHFASDQDAEVYMGIHVSLTGLRGLIAPFVGAWLYHAIGGFAFVAAAGVGALGLLGFRALARQEKVAPILGAPNKTEPRP